MTVDRERQRSVLVLPVEIAGYARRIQDGFRQHGWDAQVLDLTDDPFGYRGDPPAEPWLRRLQGAHRRIAGRAGPLGPLLASVVLMPLRLPAAVCASRGRHALVYLFGRSLLWGLDLRVARARGCRTVAVYLGGDARAPWMDGDYVNRDGGVLWPLVRLRSWQMARRVRTMERLADVVVCHPSYGQLMRRPFVSWFAVGMPVDAPADPAPGESSRPAAPHRPVRVAHAPSRPHQKGSPQIAAAVAALANHGVAVELVTLKGLPNAVVRTEIAASDLVVDQLWSDTLLAGVGVEAGQAGVLPLAFGHAGATLRAYAGPLGVPTEQYAGPDELDDRLQRAVTDPAWRARVAADVHRYVTEQSTPEQVAGRLVRVVDGDVPVAWWIDPAKLDHVLGYGMPRELAVRRLREYVDRYGERALHLHPDGAALGAVRRLLAEPVGDPPRSHLALILTNYPPHLGGVELHTEALAAELVRRGHQVTVVCLGEHASDEVRDGVRVRTLTRRLDLGGVVAVPGLAAWRGVAADLATAGITQVSVHTRYFPMTWLGLRLARRLGVPAVLTEHGGGHVVTGSTLVTRGAAAVDRTLGRRALRRAETVLAVSEMAARFVRRLAGRDAEVLGNGADASFWAEQPRARRPNLVFAGRLVEEKGWRVFVDIVAALPPTVTATLAGDGPQRAEVEQRVRAAGLAGRVAVPGRLDPVALRAEFAGSVYVNPSVAAEGFQTTLLEAGFAGASIATYDVGGAAEVVGSGGAPGRIVPVGDTAGLLAATKDLLAETRPGKPALLRRYDWPAVVDRFEAALSRAGSSRR